MGLAICASTVRTSASEIDDAIEIAAKIHI
jgi:hypothetical protein